jgi:hypothetical protein
VLDLTHVGDKGRRLACVQQPNEEGRLEQKDAPQLISALIKRFYWPAHCVAQNLAYEELSWLQPLDYLRLFCIN